MPISNCKLPARLLNAHLMENSVDFWCWLKQNSSNNSDRGSIQMANLSASKTVLLALMTLSMSSATSFAQEQLTTAQRFEKAATTELWSPEPAEVVPAKGTSAPSDAIVLFDGSDLNSWESIRGGDAKWDVENGILIVKPGTDRIQTRESFGDVQLHVEWRTPAVVAGDSQDRGNSGIFLMGGYEVQVLDSVNNPTYVNGQAGSIYKQHIPLVNASLGPGEWQTYDIVFMAPLFGRDGRLTRPATFTVFHNGILIQNNVVVQGPTEFIGKPNYQAHDERPLQLQDHGSPVAYRNIWLRKL